MECKVQQVVSVGSHDVFIAEAREGEHMIKGLALFYILSMIFHNPILALILIFIFYAAADRAFLGFLPDVSAVFRRNSRIKSLLAELRLNPANASGAQELGILYFERKRYHQALQYLTKAHERIKDSARLYLYMGMTYMELKRSEAGKEALDAAVAMDRRVGHGLPNIYLLQYELDRQTPDPPAIKELEEGLTLFASAENFFRMGIVYKKKGNRTKAKAMFNLAIEEYQGVPKRLRRIHRKWAILAKLYLYTGT